ncbi:MAG: hypothetical protein EOM20_14485 [Spartobacteria bacterium]|nr:hypothetical protein [Spartobacteria bacterium]
MSEAMQTATRTGGSPFRLFASIVTICILRTFAVHGAIYYVATNGDNEAEGAIDAPWATISSAVNRVTGGDRVIVRGGTYREEAIITNTSGTADNYIHLEAYPGETPVMKGSDVISDWIHHSGNIWKHTNLKWKCQQVFVDEQPLKMVGWPNGYIQTNVHSCGDYFYIPYGHTCHERVGNTIPINDYLADMTTNSFYYDWGTFALYVWMPDSDCPSNHIVEASHRVTIMFMQHTADFIKVTGHTFKHNNSFTKLYTGYAAVSLGESCIMESCTVEWADSSGVFLGNNGRLTHSIIANNGMQGVGGPSATNVYIARNTIVSNNYRNFTYQWGSGMKLMPNAGGLIESNTCAYNFGTGLWLDTCNTHDYKIIRNNHIHDNGFMNISENYGLSAIMIGIFVEATRNAQVYNNLVENNANGGIFASASANTRIYNNTIIGTREDRSTWYNGRDALRIFNGHAHLPNTNNWAYNNLIVNNQTDYDIQIDAPTNAYTSHNFSDYNCFFRDHTLEGFNGGYVNSNSSFVAAFGRTVCTNLAAWRTASGYDGNSMVINPRILGHHAHLASNSPCINAGLNMNWMTNVAAFDGNARILDGTVDIGAFEFAPIPDFVIEKIELSRRIVVHDDETPLEMPSFQDSPPPDPSALSDRDRPGRVAETHSYADGAPSEPVYEEALLTAYVTVKNQGSAAGDAGTVRVCVNQAADLTCGQDASATQTVGMLNAGFSRKYTFENLQAATNNGIKTLHAFVDSDCITTEDCETNNQATATYTVLDPTPFSFEGLVYTNQITLNWQDPYLSGYSNSTIMIRWHLSHTPTSPVDGALLYMGTNFTYTHEHLLPSRYYYYSFWVTDDGVTFEAPREGTNSTRLQPFRRPVQVMMRDNNTFTSGSKIKSAAKILFFSDNASAGTLDTQAFPEPFNLATKWVIEGAGNFNPATNGLQLLLRDAPNSAVCLLYFDYDGALHWEDDTNALCWTSYDVGRKTGSAWDIDGIGDINGDGQDELLLRGNAPYVVNGATKTSVKILFYDDNSGRLRDNQPYSFSLGTRWTIEGFGNFNTAPVATAAGLAEEALIRHITDGGFYLLYFNDNGSLYWNNDDTNDISWTSWSPGSAFATNAAAWDVSDVGDVNGDGQDEILLKSSYSIEEGGKTKYWYRFLFFDATNGQIRTNLPAPFKIANNWRVEAMGNFNTTNTASCDTAEQVLMQHVSDGGFYLLYFDDNGNLYWDTEDTNNVCWTSWSPGADFATNATSWSVQAVGDFIGNR